MKNYVIAGLLLFLLAAASLFLPSRVLKWQDRQRTGKSEIEEVQEVVLKEQISMTLSEKLKLRSQDTVNTLTLVNGKNYNKDTIEEQIKKEIKILADRNILIDFDTGELTLKEAAVTFYVDMEDSEKSIMLWQGFVETSKYQLLFFLDDETGKIVSFSQYAAKPVVDYGAAADVSGETDQAIYVEKYFADMDAEEQKELAARWGEYLGCEMVSSQSYPNGIMPGAEEELFQQEIDNFVSKGYSYEEAKIKTALSWGIDPLLGETFRVTFEDSGGQIVYTMGVTDRVFQIDVYMSR